VGHSHVSDNDVIVLPIHAVNRFLSTAGAVNVPLPLHAVKTPAQSIQDRPLIVHQENVLHDLTLACSGPSRDAGIDFSIGSIRE